MSLTPQEEAILQNIHVPSMDDPLRPEFPPHAPQFPATESYQIRVPEFSNVWLKDESSNRHSGTHKDRLAWEVIIIYRDFLLAKKQGKLHGALPQFSIISAGSAATAIGRMLSTYNLPQLKVLVDSNVDAHIYQSLKASHCEIFQTDLSKKELSPQEILALTNNRNGFDLTSNQGVSLEIGNYDWMSYEIINQSPDYVFVPFGTGILFKKLLEINKREVSCSEHEHDRRFRGSAKILSNCNFVGSTSNNPKTKADKLYSPHLPFTKIDEAWIKFYIQAGYCGPQTGIQIVHEEFIDQALTLAHQQNINCEASGIAGLALMLQIADTLPKDKKMLIINTGKLKYYS